MIPESTAARRVIVLDPGLKDQRGHHHVINRSLAEHGDRSGIPVTILANQRARAAEFAYPVQPVFTWGVYEDKPDLPEVAFRGLVAGHRHDLLTALAAAPPAGLVVHTATAAFLTALGEALAALPTAGTSLVVQLMFQPLSLTDRDIDPTVSEARYAAALRGLHALRRRGDLPIDISTSCNEFADVFTRLGAEAVGLHPFALLGEQERIRWERRAQQPHRRSDSARRRVFLYGGALKITKGLAWIAAALPALLAAHPTVDFVVHLGNNHLGLPALDVLRDRVLEAAARHGNLDVRQGHLPADAWDDMIATADLVVIPYSPQAYRWKTSGIYWEALLKTAPTATIAVTEGSWMAREALHSEGDVRTMRFGSSDDLVSLVASVAAGPADPHAGQRTPARPCFAQGNDLFIFSRLSWLSHAPHRL